MNWKKSFAALAVFAAFATVNPVVYAAEPEAPVEQAANAGQVNTEENLRIYKENGYKHISDRYGYSIVLPEKPVGVLPLSTLEEGYRGEVLIFKNEGYDIKNAWIVRLDAFSEDAIPADLIKKSEAEQRKVIEAVNNMAPFEEVHVTDINGVGGIYAVTAKEVQMDTNGDGKYDQVMTADTQMVRTFFRGKLGGRFSVELIDNPVITQQGEALYQFGLLTFDEIPAIKTQPKPKK